MDDINFDSETRNSLELTLEELQDAYAKLLRRFSVQTNENRRLNNELSQLKKLAADDGFTSDVIKEIRLKVWQEVSKKKTGLKKKRGRPALFGEQVTLLEIHHRFETRENKNEKLKSWLRKLVKDEYIMHGYSITTNRSAIEKTVQKYATRMSRTGFLVT